MPCKPQAPNGEETSCKSWAPHKKEMAVNLRLPLKRKWPLNPRLLMTRDRPANPRLYTELKFLRILEDSLSNPDPRELQVVLNRVVYDQIHIWLVRKVIYGLFSYLVLFLVFLYSTQGYLFHYRRQYGGNKHNRAQGTRPTIRTWPTNKHSSIWSFKPYTRIFH